jgi:hypothetical protein
MVALREQMQSHARWLGRRTRWRSLLADWRAGVRRRCVCASLGKGVKSSSLTRRAVLMYRRDKPNAIEQAKDCDAGSRDPERGLNYGYGHPAYQKTRLKIHDGSLLPICGSSSKINYSGFWHS